MDPEMKEYERFLPTQEAMSIYYDGSAEEQHKRMYEIIQAASQTKTAEELFDFTDTDICNRVRMGTPSIYMNLYQTLFAMSGVKTVLEIGTFIGLSTMQFAQFVGEKGKVTGIEKFDEFADIAQENFEKNNLSERIELIRGDATDVLKQFKYGQFDFAYIDGSKENYWNYFKALDQIADKGAIIVVDDVFFTGDVINQDCTTEKGNGCKEFLENIAKLDTYNTCVLPVSSGVCISVKK